MPNFVEVYKVLLAKRTILGAQVCAKINSELPRPLTNRAINIALDDLRNAHLAVVTRTKGRLGQVELCHSLPSDESVKALAEVVQARAVYVILRLGYDATFESPLPAEGLVERIERRFPHLDAPSVVAYMVKGNMLSHTKP